MRIKLIAITMVCIVTTGVMTRSQGSTTPLSRFHGDYQIVRGPSGTIRVADALGGSYTEWRVILGQPSHEHRMFVGAQASDGSFPVWRFEQAPAPAVSTEGRGRIEGQQFVTDFAATTDDPGRMLRERWTLTPNGGLEFALEASGQGETPRRVGGFGATRR